MAKYIVSTLFLALLLFAPAKANGLPDADHDGVPDKDEIGVYYTDMNNWDTDNDGFSDWVELNKGYSPLNPGKVLLEESDVDQDGLSERAEYKYRINPREADTDGDGYRDGDEIAAGFDPLSKETAANKWIEIDTANQTLSYYQGRTKMNTFAVSTGKQSMPTPKGEFTIKNKSPKAWSKTYGLWMPYWLGIGSFGIHELPIWPNGYREGSDHLGKPVSHGCIRLGIGPAEILYNWTEVGTKVVIK